MAFVATRGAALSFVIVLLLVVVIEGKPDPRVTTSRIKLAFIPNQVVHRLATANEQNAVSLNQGLGRERPGIVI